MKDHGDSTIFAGVNATPNIATRFFNLCCEFFRWMTSRHYVDESETRSDQSEPRDHGGSHLEGQSFH